MHFKSAMIFPPNEQFQNDMLPPTKSVIPRVLHWSQKVVTLATSSPLAASEVVRMTTSVQPVTNSGEASDAKVVNTMTIWFQWSSKRFIYVSLSSGAFSLHPCSKWVVMGLYSQLSISRGHISLRCPQGTPHSSPVRVSYGAFHLSFACTLKVIFTVRYAQLWAMGNPAWVSQRDKD